MDSILPFHAKPKPDEILSSWIIRIASANGLAPESLTSERWDRDLDSNPAKSLLRRLAALTGATVAAVAATTLESYEGTLFESRSDSSLPQWILPLGIFGDKRRGYGMQLCALCLEADPYFKKAWRLALSVACCEHRVLLRDRCAGCGRPITYHDLPRVRRAGRLQPLMACPGCKSFYTNSSGLVAAAPDILEAQGTLNDAMDCGFATINSEPVHALLFFQGLRSMIGTMITGKRSTGLRAAISQSGTTVAAASGWRKGERFEFLNVEKRAEILHLIPRLLEDWPHKFVAACRTARIRRSDLLNGYRSVSTIPYWYACQISKMTKAQYRMNSQEISAILRYAESQDREPLETLRSLFGSMGNLGNQKQLFANARALGWCKAS